MGRHVKRRSRADKDRAAEGLRIAGYVANILAALAKFAWWLWNK